MPSYNALSMFGKIRTEAHKLITSELEKYGITDIVPAHGDLLAHLYQEDGVSVKELAARVHRTQPTVTVLVNKLEKLGYVYRTKSGEDSRVTFVNLTEQSLLLKPKFQQISEKLNEVIYGGLEISQSEELEQLLTKIYKRF